MRPFERRDGIVQHPAPAEDYHRGSATEGRVLGKRSRRDGETEVGQVLSDLTAGLILLRMHFFPFPALARDSPGFLEKWIAPRVGNLTPIMPTIFDRARTAEVAVDPATNRQRIARPLPEARSSSTVLDPSGT